MVGCVAERRNWKYNGCAVWATVGAAGVGGEHRGHARSEADNASHCALAVKGRIERRISEVVSHLNSLLSNDDAIGRVRNR
jgi:hypothetical protein